MSDGVHPVLADLAQQCSARQGVIRFQVLARSLILTHCSCVDTFSLLRHLHLLGNVTIPLGVVLEGEIISYLVSIYTLQLLSFYMLIMLIIFNIKLQHQALSMNITK